MISIFTNAYKPLNACVDLMHKANNASKRDSKGT